MKAIKKKSKSRTYKIAVTANCDIDVTNVNENYMGEINIICTFCNAKHFKFKCVNERKIFNYCWHKGKVILPDENVYPDRLKQLAIKNTCESSHLKKK